MIATIDFETYSPAGFVWDEQSNKFKPLPYARKKGLEAVGAARYSEHPDAEVLCLAYTWPEKPNKPFSLWRWFPEVTDNPQGLFDYLANGGLLEAWNVTFEYWVWTNICVKKYGWPELPVNQLRCAMAKSRAFGLPGKLKDAGEILNIKNKKDAKGDKLIKWFCVPRDPTKTNVNKRNIFDPVDILSDDQVKNFIEYNGKDVLAEIEISSLVPDLSDFELKFWQCDQAINRRGVQIDIQGLEDCIKIVEQARIKYDGIINKITGGIAKRASELPRIKLWARKSHNFDIDSLNALNTELLLKCDYLPTPIRTVIEAREQVNSAAVSKLFTIKNQLADDGRLHDLFVYHAARTGRAAGKGAQPQNLPRDGAWPSWNRQDAEKALCIFSFCNGAAKAFSASSSLDYLNIAYPNISPIALVSGCLRSLFIAKPGHVLIGSDYNSIEAVVLAALAGEEWRLEVFRTHGKIYEMSAAKIRGVPFDGNQNKELRMLGKVAELASGYQGWIGAWEQAGAGQYLSKDEIKTAILNWRKASPNIVEFWGGQQRNWNKEYYGVEGSAILAVLSPGKEFNYKQIGYIVKNDILYCRLPSGRNLVYHRPRLTASSRPHREGTYELSFESWNTNPKYGPTAWLRMSTYGGKLAENIVQAVARDILANAIINLESLNLPVVLHVHDEIVCEIPESIVTDTTIDFFEKILMSPLDWAKNWPIKASGGWINKRYGK